MWSFTRVTGFDYDAYLVKIGDYYLARAFTGLDGNAVTLVSAVSDEAYWRVEATAKDGETVYVLFEPQRQYYLRLDMNRNVSPIVPEGVSCDDSRPWAYPEGSFPTRDNGLWIISLASELVKNWTVVYEPNDGEETDPVTSQVLASASITIGTNDFKKPGYEITSWNTKPDGTGESFETGSVLSGNGVLVSDYQMKLYAQWNPVYVDITYTAGGNGSVEIIDSGDKQSSITQTISSSNGLLKDATDKSIQGVTAVANKGYHFGSWSSNDGTISEALRFLGTLTAEDVMSLSYYEDGDSATKIFHNIALIANFLSNTYTINFDANGGTGSIAPRTVAYGDTSVLTGKSGLTRANYSFKGWNTKADGSGIFVGDAATLEALLAEGVLGDADGSATKLYALWEQAPSNGGNPSNQGGSSNGGASNGNNGGTAGANPTNTYGGSNGGSYGGNRSYGSFSSSSSNFTNAEEMPVVEATAVDLLEHGPVSSELITTQKANNGFFTTPLGIGILIVAGLAVAAAVIAGAIAFVTGAGAGSSRGGVFSRLRG